MKGYRDLQMVTAHPVELSAIGRVPPDVNHLGATPDSSYAWGSLVLTRHNPPC